MKCTRVEKFLPLYVADDLTGRRRKRALEDHLAACERCRRAAAEHHASRELFRADACAPDFDGEFYEEIRNSVLARIRSDRTLAPPRGFSRLFDARPAYAATLALLVLFAALALHSYTRRAPDEEGAHRKLMANATRERPTTPATITNPATITPPQASRPRSNERPTPRPSDEPARATMNNERQAAKSLLPKPGASIERARNAAQTVSPWTPRAPSYAGRNQPVPTPAARRAAQANAGELAATGANDGGTVASSEISSIEIQTADPNIRIIWLSPNTQDAARPLK